MMVCPICGTKCGQHMNELGTWYDCPKHGSVALVPYPKDKELAEVACHDEYVDAVQHSSEVNTGG